MATSNDFSDGIDNKKLKKKIKAGEDEGCPSFPIMTINMNGKEGTAIVRRKLLRRILKSFPSAIIFCQEIPGEFKTVVPHGCEACPNGTRAAVIWAEKDFVSLEGFKTTDTRIKKIHEDYADSSELLSRISMVKLTLKQDEKSILAVSYHGRLVKNKQERPTAKEFKALLEFLSVVIKKNHISSYIIGGDFNVNTLEVDLTEKKYVKVPSFELSARQESSLIPHKDNFVYYPKNIIKVSYVRFFDLESDLTPDDMEKVQDSTKKGAKEPKATEILDHDPIVGFLVFKEKGKPKSSSKVTDESVEKVTKSVGKLSL